MPQPEEVDEINEFLLKRREKQRIGELPRDDYTPGFAKKISSAIFGKPRVEVKPPLKSTQPTYASTQAQAAMRQQLDEIMEARPTNTVRNAYAAPTPKTTAPSSQPFVKSAPLGKSPASTPSSPPKPAVPNYYSNMPYPPYIQRGLATLDKKNPVPVMKTSKPADGAPRPPAPTFTKPAAWPASTPKTIDPAPVMRTNTNASAPLPPTNSTATNASTAKTVSSSSAPAPRATAYGAKPFTPAPQAKTVMPAPAPPVPITKKESVPFWKKIFAKKEKDTDEIAPMAKPVSLMNVRPSPYYAPPPSVSNKYAPLDTIVPISSPRETPTIAPVPRTIAPVSSTNEKKSPPPINTLLPATALPVPVVQTPASQTREKDSPFSTPTTYTSSRPITPTQRVDITAPRPTAPTPPRTTVVQPEMKTILSEKKISPQTNAPPLPAQPYAPPWVARTTPRDVTMPTPTGAETLPWKQPFGTESHSTETKEKNSSSSASAPGLAPKAIPRAIDEERVTLAKEQKSQEIDVRELEKSAAHDAALDEEISEEEALEKLPFEDVEGLSASDLDYLSKKEKEHRQAQEEKENDLGIPSELKNTLQRQSTQLQGALQPGNGPTNDEKQEILRRLKKMMEDEGHQ